MEQEEIIDTFGTYQYGGLIWKILVSGYGSTSRIPLSIEVWLAKALREQTVDADLDAKQYKA